MTDIAELGFQVNTGGLKEGSRSLDEFNKKGKEAEEQTKRTSDAASKAGDGAKKLGTDTKAAADGMSGMSKSAKEVSDALDKQIVKMQLTAAEYKVLQALQKAGTTLDSEAGKAIAARALALEAGIAGTRRAAVGETEFGQALSALFPTLTATSAATRAMAVEKEAAALASINLRQALRTIKPIAQEAGASLGAIAGFSTAARGGLATLGAVATGAAALGLAQVADRAENSRARFGALTNSASEGAKTFHQLREITDRGGVSFDTLSGAVEKTVGALVGVKNTQPGVFQVGDNAIRAKEKVVAAFGEIDRVLRATHTPGKEIEKAFGDLQGQAALTAETFKKLQTDAPTLARALTTAFLGPEASMKRMEDRLTAQPAKWEEITSRLRAYDAAADKALNTNRITTVDESLRQMGRTWDEVVQTIGKTGALDNVNKAFSGLSELLKIITGQDSPAFKAAIADVSASYSAELVKMNKADDSWVVSFSDATKKASDAFLGFVDTVATGGANVISTLENIVSKAGEAAAAAANALTNSPAGGPDQGFPAITDMGNLSGNALGNAFSGGRVVPFARGGIVSRPTLFPMASGAGLMGEAGPEAVMPLTRGTDGKLGVKANRSAGISEDWIDAFEQSTKDQTTELRDAIGTSADRIVAAIKAGNILLQDLTVKATPSSSVSGASAGTVGSTAGTDNKLRPIRTSGGWMQFLGPQGFVTSSVKGQSSGNSGSIAESLGFYDAWGGGRGNGGGDALRGGGGGGSRGGDRPPPIPNVPGGGGGGVPRGSGESTPAGVGGGYNDLTVRPLASASESSGGFLGAGASSATNYDYGTDTAYTNSGFDIGYNAAGGMYQVPGSGPVPLRGVVHGGETVEVRRAGDGGGINISVTVNATDANSFLENQGAMKQAMRRAVEDAVRDR